MGVPSWMVRRFPRGGRGVDDEVKLDPKKGFVENLREVLSNVCKRQGISEDKRIAYLNSFIRLLNPGNNPEIGISRDDFFHCLRPLLIHESVRIRATALNLVKHFLRSKQDFASCVKLQYPFLIARSLDLKVQSDTERVQAICVARRMLSVNATEFPLAVARALVAVATSTIDEKDRLLRASLAALVELCILNPETFITAGGVTALIRNLGSITMARMAESMLGALLFLLNDPVTRSRAHIDLSCLAVPYTEGGPQGGSQGGTRLEWAHVVLVSLLRSWPGMLHFCHTQREGLRSLVATLYLNQHEVRRSVVDLLYEVLNVCQPEWSDEAQVALDAVDPSRHQDAYRLADGFVAQEGRTVLPHCSRTRVNLQEVHLSLLLYSFLEAGILDAIVEVIVSDDSFLSVRATILLGELLHLTHLLLPPECCHVTPVMPTLVSYAVRGRRSATSLTQTNFGANRHQAGSNSSAHYERFKRQMQQDEQRRMRRRREAVGGGGGGEGKRERRRTVSGQSCRSRTVSDSSGDRSRLDRDSVSASNEPYNAGQPKTTSKATSLLRDIQAVLKDNSELNSSATSLDDNNHGQQQLQDTDKVVPEIVGDGTKVDVDKKGPEIVEDRDVDKVTLENLNRQFRDCIKVGTDRVTLENLDRQFHGDKAGQNRFFGARNWEPGQQPLPEFFEKGAPASDEDLTARYPVDEPFSIRVQQRALTAVATLARLHRMLRKRPAPSSIFLDHLITSIDKKQSPTSSELARAKGKTLSKSKLSQLLNKESEEAIKDSGVLIVKDPFSWNWDVIRSILKGKPDFSNETTHRQFLRKLLQFFLPSSRQLMRIDVGSDRRIANIYTMTALDFLDCLVVSSVKDTECEKILLELFGNISTEICQVKSAPHSCLLSPQNVSGTLCSDYFLYVGHLSRSETGRSVLDKTGVFNLLLELITCINLDCYVKLIVSTLDYTEPGFARKIMDTVLKSDVVGFRMYATKMLHVMLRTPMQACQSMIDWVIVGLIEKVSDTDRAISNVALEALDEACDCVEYLRSVVKMYPVHLETLSDSGLLVGVRLLSTPEGFVRGLGDGFVRRQLEYWGEEMNLRYVCVVEGRLCDSLTLHERNEDGTYCGRVSGVKRSPGDVFVPAHLYGQLVQHEAGFKMLIEDQHVKRMVEIVHQSNTCTERAVLELKAALWALGAVASWPVGVRWVCAQGITQAILRLVTASFGGVYSVRATALYALSMMATSEDGACALREEGGWHTTRHNRHERWPVLVKLDLLEDVVVNDDEEQDTSQDSSSLDQSADPNTGTLGRGHFYLPLDSDDQLMAGSADSQLTAADGQLMRQRRAATLPARGTSDRLMPGYQHIRSYSESKADEECPSADSRANLSIEGLRKNRPSSCDISSGSSTDSVQQYGKYNVADRIQTLSPIPSSGSLTTIKYPAVTNPRSRRTSVTNSVSSHKSARLSQQDAQGYATLRFLHRGRRPLLNTTNQLTTSFNQLTTTFNQLTPLSPIEQLASADLRRQISPLVRPRNMVHQVEASEFEGGVGAEAVLCDVTAGKNVHNMMPYQSSRSCIARGSDASGAEESSWSGPTYLGICLPHNLCDLFPSDDLRHDKPKPYNRTDVDTNQDAGADNSSADSETDTGTDSGGGGGVALLAVTAANSNRQRRRHDRQNCLLCTSNRAANQRVSRLRKISSSSTHRTRTETESSYGAPNEGESPIMLPWQTRGGLEGVNSVDSSSSATSIVHRSPMDNMRSRSMVRRDILKMASQLSNPVLYKTCKQALLQLKQLYNDLFQDICVYSDVCSIIANSMHRIQARRFLQELFLDIPFTELYEDAITLLSTNGDNGGLDEYQDNQLTSAGGGGGDQLMQNQLASAQSAADGGGGGDSCDANSSSGYRVVGGMKAGAKSAFNDEQRSNPLLEVIPEHDARSDGSSRADSLSQSMLNLSDFSAPNSFDANDGVACLLSTSLDTTAYNQPTTTSPPLVQRPRLHSTSSAASSSPMVLLSHSNSLPSYKSGSRISFKTGLRSSSQSPSAEKAKQMIEMSSSKISVLQEALKKTGGSSSSLTAAANQRAGFGVGVAEVTNEKRGAGKVGLEVTNERRGAEDSGEKATNQERGFESSSLEVTNEKKGADKVGLEVSNERRGTEGVGEKATNQNRGFERSDLEATNEKGGLKGVGLDATIDNEASKIVGFESTNKMEGLKRKVSVGKIEKDGSKVDDMLLVDLKKISEVVDIKESSKKKILEAVDILQVDQNKISKDYDLEVSSTKKGLDFVDLEATEMKKLEVVSVDPEKVSKIVESKRGLDSVNLLEDTKESKVVGLKSAVRKEESKNKDLKSAELKVGSKVEEEIEPSVYLAKDDPSLKLTKVDPSLKLTEVDPSLKLTEVDPSLKLTKVDPSLNLTMVDPSLSSLLKQVDSNLSSLKSDEFSKLDLSLSNPESYQSKQSQKVDLGLSKLGLEVDSVASVVSYEETVTKTQFKFSENLVSTGESFESQIKSRIKTDIDSAVNFGNVVSGSNLAPGSDQESSKTLKEISSTKNVDNLQRLSSIEKASLKSSCSSHSKSVGEASKQQKSLTKNVSKTGESLKDFESGSGVLKIEGSSPKQELKSESVDLNLESSDLKLKSGNPRTEVSSLEMEDSCLKRDNSSLKSGSSSKLGGSSSNRDSSQLKAGNSSSKSESSLKLDDSSSKRDSLPLEAGNSSLKSESSLKLDDSSSNRDSLPLKAGNSSSKLEDFSSKLDSSLLKVGNSSLKSESSLKLEDSSSKRDSSLLKDKNSSLKSESSSKLEDSSSKRDCSPLKVDNSSSKSESSSKLEDSSSKRDSSPLKAGNSSSTTKKASKSDGSSLKTDSKSGIGSSKLNCGSSKIECSSESDSKPISKSDITALKPECIDNSSSKVKKSSSKLESATSRPESNTLKSVSSSLQSESISSKSVISSLKSESSTSSKTDSSSSKFEISNSKLEISSSKPSKDSKTNIRGKRLKSQQNTGPSLLSNSLSPSNSSSSKTKITPKRNEDVTGSGSVHTKPGLATDNTKPAGSGTDNTKPGSATDNTKHTGSGTDNTKPGLASDNTKPAGSGIDNTKPGSATDNTKPAGSGTDNTKPGLVSDNTKPALATDNTKPAGSGTDNTKPGLPTDNTKPAGSGTDNTKPGLVNDSKKPGLVGDNTKPSSVSDSTKPTTVVKNQRQRKKATAKEPIRESLEVGKK